MPREAPITIASFIPQDDYGFFNNNDKRAYARGKLAAHIQRVAWEAVMDEGPTSVETVEFVHRLTCPEWRENPVAALTEINTVTDRYDRWVDAQREQHGIPSDVLTPRGIQHRWYRARELFGKYHAALLKMKLIELVDTGVMGGSHFSDTPDDSQPTSGTTQASVTSNAKHAESF